MVWQPLLEQLPEWIEAICIDLPGHGVASQKSFETLEDLSAALVPYTEQPAIWVGWSLGGLAVLQLALKYPERVKGLLLTASSPCFVRKPGWSCAMHEDIFTGFADELEKDFSGTIRRFLSLQVRGSESGRKVLKTLRQKILAQPPANIAALRAGLSVLKTADLSSQLEQLAMPVSWVLGERDTLISAALVEQLKLLSPQSEITLYEHAAHAPFLSHLERFSEQLISFVKDIQ